MYSKRLCLIFLFSMVPVVMAYNSLTVRNPGGWQYGQGTIEEAILAIHPHGLYMECGLYLTFSARGLNFLSTDILEVEFHFDLPPKAIVHDSWLWIGEDIIQAKMLDRWTASQIYEGIVNRRRDPSILLKNDQTHYEFRIFPMTVQETRKVKISYLVPTQWTSSSVQAYLPTPLLQTSRYPVSKFYIFTWLPPEWKNPKIEEYPDITFTPKYDEKFGPYYRTIIGADAHKNTLNFSLDAPYKNGLYFSQLERGNNKLYQFAILPAKVFNLRCDSKVVFAVDYMSAKSNVSASVIFNTLKSILHQNFSATDSFNIIYSQLNVKRASEHWLPADSLTIESTMTNLGANPFSSYGNLPGLIANSCEFIQQNGKTGTLLLIANSDQLTEYETANKLIVDMEKMISKSNPINVIDIQNINVPYRWIGGIYYQGNEYFYENITRMSSGTYLNIRKELNVNRMFVQFLSVMKGYISFFDLHASINEGICYARQNFNIAGEPIYLNGPVLQIGKYEGTFPFILEMAGIMQGEVLKKRIEIPITEALEADTLIEEMWAGNYLQSLESAFQSNATMHEIINYSMNERILSLHTALLCLEPKLGGQILSNPWDESELISDVTADYTTFDNDTLIQAYPNPFNEQTHIKIQFAKSLSQEKLSFKIYNILGQVVRSYEPSDFINGNELTWNGLSSEGLVVPSGVYFFVMEGPGFRKSLKLLLLK